MVGKDWIHCDAELPPDREADHVNGDRHRGTEPQAPVVNADRRGSANDKEDIAMNIKRLRDPLAEADALPDGSGHDRR